MRNPTAHSQSIESNRAAHLALPHGSGHNRDYDRPSLGCPTCNATSNLLWGVLCCWSKGFPLRPLAPPSNKVCNTVGFYREQRYHAETHLPLQRASFYTKWGTAPPSSPAQNMAIPLLPNHRCNSPSCNLANHSSNRYVYPYFSRQQTLFSLAGKFDVRESTN